MSSLLQYKSESERLLHRDVIDRVQTFTEIGDENLSLTNFLRINDEVSKMINEFIRGGNLC